VCVAPVTISATHPTVAPVLGGTLVTVTGANFLENTIIMCKFGSAGLTEATWVTATRVTCPTPASATAGSVTVQVSPNNQDFASSSVSFTYQGWD
jgi:hypothetical protein